MANLSQIKREQMIAFLEKLKEHHNDDESLIAFNQIEKELTSKKYGLVWEEHEEKVDVIMETKIPVFTEVKEKEIIGDSKNDSYNFLLEGDNLHSLKLLEKTHKGRIDVIYIDPPYNTGKNDFRYDDTWIVDEDSYRHSKWLSFISKRLLCTKKLLSHKGIIFISIDDNEIGSMRLVCDDIFGENNRIATLVWKKRYQGAKEKHIVVCHEYILVYAKSIEAIPTIFVPSDEEYAKKYFKEKDEFGFYRTQPLEAGKSMDDRENLKYPITSPDGTVIHPKRQWIWSKEHVDEGIKKHIIGFKQNKNKEWSVFIKQYLHDENGEQRKTKQFSIIDGVYTQHGTKEIDNIFGDINVFKFPKPHALIKQLLQIASYIKEPVILDFFAGSGTTAQAVMELNKEDGGNRKFILCTNNESNICEEVTYQRIRTVITGKRADGSEYSSGISSNLKYYKTSFVEKDDDDLYDNLLDHVGEMIQLQYGIRVDNKKYVIIMDDDEMDAFEKEFDKYDDLKAVFINQDVLLSTSQESLLANVNTFTIPDCYFDFELREAGELW